MNATLAPQIQAAHGRNRKDITVTPQIKVAITVSVGDQSQDFFATANSSDDGFNVAHGVLNGACGDASKWLYERQSASRRPLRGVA